MFGRAPQDKASDTRPRTTQRAVSCEVCWQMRGDGAGASSQHRLIRPLRAMIFSATELAKQVLEQSAWRNDTTPSSSRRPRRKNRCKSPPRTSRGEINDLANREFQVRWGRKSGRRCGHAPLRSPDPPHSSSRRGLSQRLSRRTARLYRHRQSLRGRQPRSTSLDHGPSRWANQASHRGSKQLTPAPHRLRGNLEPAPEPTPGRAPCAVVCKVAFAAGRRSLRDGPPQTRQAASTVKSASSCRQGPPAPWSPQQQATRDAASRDPVQSSRLQRSRDRRRETARGCTGWRWATAPRSDRRARA